MPAHKLPDGRWAEWVDLGRDAEGNRIRRRREGRTKREAEAKARELRERHKRGEDVTTKPRTFGELLDDWIALLRTQGKAANTITAYASGAKKHVRPAFGAVPVTKLRLRDLQRLIDALAEELAPTHLRLIKTILVQPLNLAIEQGEISVNPAEKIRLPRAKRGPARSLTDAERDRLLAAAAGQRYALALKIALLGARRGEIAGLQRRDFDLEAGTMTIRRQLQRERGKWVAKELKHGSPPRTLAIGPATVQAVQEHLARQDEECQSEGWANPEGWLFLSATTGTVCPASTIYTFFKDTCTAAKVEAARLHDCRHTAATSMLSDGEDITSVSGALGHASAAITLGIYAHAIPGKVAGATRRLDEGMGIAHETRPADDA
jgi:integrase